MSSKSKKLDVLYQLSQEMEPLSLSDLVEKLGNVYAERSVRRWLAELISEGLVERFGEKKGSKYQVIKRADRGVGKSKNCFDLESTKIIERVKHPLYERNPIAYADHWFDAYQPNSTFYYHWKKESN